MEDIPKPSKELNRDPRDQILLVEVGDVVDHNDGLDLIAGDLEC